ncbi:MAG: sodium-translocating pyrophosphatase [Anaerolineae bacterium]|nr:sodium-translocating pyrophosphatase [Anaerolineae bacterium]
MGIVLAASLTGVIVALIGLAFAWYQRTFVLAQSPGNAAMQKISAAIQKGAQAFLRREYRAVAIFVAVITVALLILSAVPGSQMSPWTAFAFVCGAVASGIAGWVGMYIAVRANVRTTQAASESLDKGLRVAFSSGTVMGTTVVGLALLGIGLLYLLFGQLMGDEVQAANALAGFGFGGTSIAIFARVGGGIYTKAADVGADLVGKTEENIPEDDPRNPAVIADNVGDNVGDVAGMGSDLFESYASSIVAAILLAALPGGGIVASDQVCKQVEAACATAQAFPLFVAAAGLLIGIACTFLVHAKEGATLEELLGSLRRGVWSASGGVAVAIIVIALLLQMNPGVIVATLSGLIGGVLIGYFTEYYTSSTYKPTQELANSAAGGTGIVIIRGLALGMFSTLPPVVVVVTVTLLATAFAGLYGVAVAAVGMLATLGITLATDAYGPVADNAGGIAEMAGLPKNVRERTDALDSLGNTTAATGKGFAIGSAAMTALALTAAFITAVGLTEQSSIGQTLLDPHLVTGLFIGAVLPYIFSALTMLAVGNAAQGIVDEVRRQFREIPGLREGTADPDYEACVGISTDYAIRQMLLPGVIAVLVPVALTIFTILGQDNFLGTFFSPVTIIGMLLGSLGVAFMLAIMMSNAGGAWDNAKKYIEAGHLGGKGSEAHKAAVVGDTVGDPFKDTSGPSLNILLKLLAIVALVIAPLINSSLHDAAAQDTAAVEQVVEPAATDEAGLVTEAAPLATAEATPGG